MQRTMQRIRIQKKRATRRDDGRYDVLPLDPRDPDILRAKRAAGLGRPPSAA